MFILRRVIDEQGSAQSEINNEVGTNYSFITKGRNKKQFDSSFEIGKYKSEEYDEIFGFVLGSGGEFPLFVKDTYYIMTETGKTFSRL